VLLVVIILHQTAFINPVFPALPGRIPCVFPVKKNSISGGKTDLRNTNIEISGKRVKL
jgi:hypothetical protein